MKKFLIIFSFVYLFLNCNLFSQQLYFFKAKDAYQLAKEYTITQGMSDPKLLVILSSGVLSIGGNPTPAKFDIENGTANVWIYLFKDNSNPDNYFAVGVVYPDIIQDYFPVYIDPQDIIEKAYFLDLNSTFEDEEWINSDEFAAILRDDMSFMEFVVAFPEYNTQIMLLKNEFFEFFPKYHYYWGIRVEAEGWSKLCAVEAYTKQMYCEEATTVDFKNTNIICEAFPNPFTNQVKIRFNLDKSSNVKLSIFDNLGNLVTVLNNGVLESGEKVFNFSPTGLSKGIYYYKLQIGNTVKVQKLIMN